jgi:hypothetical protein
VQEPGLGLIGSHAGKGAEEPPALVEYRKEANRGAPWRRLSPSKHRRSSLSEEFSGSASSSAPIVGSSRWFRQTRTVGAEFGLVVLGLVTRGEDGKHSAAEETGATLHRQVSCQLRQAGDPRTFRVARRPEFKCSLEERAVANIEELPHPTARAKGFAHFELEIYDQIFVGFLDERHLVVGQCDQLLSTSQSGPLETGDPGR